MSDFQESLDRFYMQNGKCCAGCDWWRHFSSRLGYCTKSAPVAESERWAIVGIVACSLTTGAGHIVTPSHHVCGDFKDDFDWTTLTPHYLRKIGFVKRIAT